MVPFLRLKFWTSSAGSSSLGIFASTRHDASEAAQFTCPQLGFPPGASSKVWRTCEDYVFFDGYSGLRYVATAMIAGFVGATVSSLVLASWNPVAGVVACRHPGCGFHRSFFRSTVRLMKLTPEGLLDAGRYRLRREPCSGTGV